MAPPFGSWDQVEKDEFLALHALLMRVRAALDEVTPSQASYREYETNGVQAQHIHRSKHDHHVAVLLLGEGIANHMAIHKPLSTNQRAATHLHDLATLVPKPNGVKP